MSNSIAAFSKCANCGACQNICPKDAIRVESDGWFYRVAVNAEKCVECGLCQAVCPVNRPSSAQHLEKAYGAIHTNRNVVRKSSSGGVFSALAEYVMEHGGVVYGAAYTEDFRQVVYQSTDETSLDRLRRSKYVESLTGYSFREIKKHLQNNRMVLFCGAPCQVAGLTRFLGKKYENLITCDFSCGGFPGHGVFQKYLKELQQRYGGKPITDVNFRPKDFGWMIHSISVSLGKKKWKRPMSTDPYFHAFLKTGTVKREYCYGCDFADNHHADFVLADFWMYGTISDYPRIWDGLSLVLTNSPKAEKVMKALGDRLELQEQELSKASYNIKKVEAAPEHLEARRQYLQDLEESGVFKAAEHRGMPTGLPAEKCRILAMLSMTKNRVKAILKLR